MNDLTEDVWLKVLTALYEEHGPREVDTRDKWILQNFAAGLERYWCRLPKGREWEIVSPLSSITEDLHEK